MRVAPTWSSDEALRKSLEAYTPSMEEVMWRELQCKTHLMHHPRLDTSFSDQSSLPISDLTMGHTEFSEIVRTSPPPQLNDGICHEPIEPKDPPRYYAY
jgi:hypothetical protein